MPRRPYDTTITTRTLLMPLMPARPCPGRGPRAHSCPNLIRGSQRCCPECQKYEKATTKAYDSQRGDSGQRGYDANWQKVRAWKARCDPLCEMCLKQGISRALDVVHHIVPIVKGGARLDLDNLMSICSMHHEEIHKAERWGR